MADLGDGLPFPGSLYRHFKGGLYEVLMTASDAESHRTMVIYRSIEHGKVWSRALDYQVAEHPPSAWLDKVRWPDGEVRARFVRSDWTEELRRLIDEAGAVAFIHDRDCAVWNKPPGEACTKECGRRAYERRAAHRVGEGGAKP